MEPPIAGAARPNRRLWGVLVRKECWRLSWRGWLAILALGLAAGAAIFFEIHPFLAVTHRVDAKVLVVEGWVHEFATRMAVAEFKNGHYEHVYTTGGPVDWSGGYVNDFQTAASVGADLLRKNGLPNDSLQMVPSRVMDRDRTFGSAVALRQWFQEHHLRVNRINVLTEDAHARRTRLLFQKAFGDTVEVGVISVPDPDYDPRHWWRSSEGVREVVGEGLAYIYARFFFHPAVAEGQASAGPLPAPSSQDAQAR